MAFYQQKYIQLKDSTFNEQMTTNLMKAQATYLERENTARIESQSQVLALKEEIIKSQYQLNILIGVGALILVGIALLLVRSNKQKQILNLLLDQKVKERTRELELNRDALFNTNQEMNTLILQTSDDIRSHLATIDGLHKVGLKDIHDPLALKYMSNVE